MIVVIEGPDGVGKTTLAKMFQDYGYHYIHNGPPKPGVNVFDDYTQQIVAAKGTGQNIVFDRLHVGELVYGEVMRGKSELTIEQLRLLNRILFANGGYVIYCNLPVDEVEQHWLKRKGQEYVDQADKIRKVHELYCQIRGSEFNSFNTYDFNYHNNGFSHAQSYAVSRSKHCPSGVVGSPINRFLFVGEQAGGTYDFAFYSYERSSHFLNECLWDAGFEEFDMAFTNAYTMKGPVRSIKEIWRKNTDQIVITLGEKAAAVCNHQAVPHLEAPHPQYVKRFKSSQRKKYVQQLSSFRGGIL